MSSSSPLPGWVGSSKRPPSSGGTNQSIKVTRLIGNMLTRLARILSQFAVQILQRDFFNEDWKCNLARAGKTRILVIGNPPWVTNSDLGQLGSKNLPTKTNFQGLRGFDARTGKSNFDISEWMLVRLIEALPPDGAIAMLCKTMTARKVLRHFWKTCGGLQGSSLFQIDAKAEFDVAVDACLFFASGKRTTERVAAVYTDLDTASTSTRFGFVDGTLVSNLDAYRAHKSLDGGSSTYIWRSGVKHDAASVMEFTRGGRKLINGFGELVDIEEDYVFPLLKSSDLGNGRTTIRKSVLVTQKHTGDDTSEIEQRAPKTWRYLMRHADALGDRKTPYTKIVLDFRFSESALTRLHPGRSPFQAFTRIFPSYWFRHAMAARSW